MDSRKTATEYRMAQWAQALQERIANGESIDGFCQSRGISRNTYFYWQRKLREVACAELSKAQNNEASLVPTGWAKLPEKPTAENKNSLIVEVGGYRLIVNEATDSELLKKICRVLVTLC
jgi:putative transposase